VVRVVGAVSVRENEDIFHARCGVGDSCSYRGAIGIHKASKVSIFVYLRKLSKEQSKRHSRSLYPARIA
jgi:hypothetical protein